MLDSFLKELAPPTYHEFYHPNPKSPIPAQTAQNRQEVRSCTPTDILADNEVDYKEAYELLYWLEDNPAFAREHPRLWHTTQEVLLDDQLDDFEADLLNDILRETLEDIH